MTVVGAWEVGSPLCRNLRGQRPDSARKESPPPRLVMACFQRVLVDPRTVGDMARGQPADHGPRENILRHDCARRDNRSFTYRHARKNCDPRTEPRAVAHSHRRLDVRKLRVPPVVLSDPHCCAAADAQVRSNLKAAAGVENDTLRDETICARIESSRHPHLMTVMDGTGLAHSGAKGPRYQHSNRVVWKIRHDRDDYHLGGA